MAAISLIFASASWNFIRGRRQALWWTESALPVSMWCCTKFVWLHYRSFKANRCLFSISRVWDNSSSAEAASGNIPFHSPGARHRIRGPPASPPALLCTVRDFRQVFVLFYFGGSLSADCTQIASEEEQNSLFLGTTPLRPYPLSTALRGGHESPPFWGNTALLPSRRESRPLIFSSRTVICIRTPANFQICFG